MNVKMNDERMNAMNVVGKWKRRGSFRTPP